MAFIKKELFIQYYDTESLAKYAFSIFYQAVQFAEKNNVPVILDF